MTYVSLLTSTECAIWPVPIRNYYLMPPKLEGGWIILGWSSRTRSGDFCMSWKNLRWCWHCDDLGVCHWLLIQSYSTLGQIRSTSPIRTLRRHSLDQLFSNCTPRNPGVPCGMSVFPRGNFNGNRTFPVCFHRHLRDLVNCLSWQKGKIFLGAQLDTTQQECSD